MSVGEQRRRITARDVAAVVGVTPATVSKALNDSPEVSEATRTRVLDAVRRLGYRPNSVARGLRARRTHTLGLVTDDLEGVFTTAMMRGVEEVASSKEFGVFLCNSYGSTEKERDRLETLLDKQVDGVILLSGYRVRERSGPAIALPGTPAVFLFQYTNDAPVPCILPDDEMGARIATDHLLGLGRKRIGFINGPPHYEATHDRLAGYRSALASADVPYRPDLVRVGAAWYQDEGYAQMTDLLEAHEDIDAVVCASDHMAAGALDALHSHGRRVPDDVAVVGFDDRPFSRHLRPPLTSVALPLYDMGWLAGERLLSAIGGEAQEHEVVRMPCSLVIRESCGSGAAGS